MPVNPTYYILVLPFLPWLWPLLGIIGITCQLAAIYLRSFLLPIIGLSLVIVAAIAQSDLALLAGDLIATFLIYVLLTRLRGKP